MQFGYLPTVCFHLPQFCEINLKPRNYNCPTEGQMFEGQTELSMEDSHSSIGLWPSQLQQCPQPHLVLVDVELPQAVQVAVPGTSL